MPAAADDLWPRTRRPAPWLAAALLVLICLVPFDAVEFRVPTPVDANLDRVVIALAFGSLTLIALGGRGIGGERHRLGPPEVLLGLFTVVCLLSVTFNYTTLERTLEATAAVKQVAIVIALLGIYATFVIAIRREEADRFITLLLALAVIAALGTVFENLTRTNVFYLLVQPLKAVASVRDAVYFAGSDTRPSISGPARHGLAIATLLAMALPFAVLRSTEDHRGAAWRVAHAAAAVVLFLGALFTLRRSGIVLPSVAVGVTAMLLGRRGLPLLGGAAAVLFTVVVLLPSVAEQSVDQLLGGDDAAAASSRGRTTDYAAIVPDLQSRTLLGRGFGTYSSERILDNQYLGLLIGVGVLGTALYGALLLSILGRAVRLSRAGPRDRRSFAIACAASAAVFVVCNALFDTLAFPHAPYAFLFVAAMLNRTYGAAFPGATSSTTTP